MSPPRFSASACGGRIGFVPPAGCGVDASSGKSVSLVHILVLALLAGCGPSTRELDERAWSHAQALWKRGEHAAAFLAWQRLRPGSAQATEAHRRLQEADRHYGKAVARFRADQPGVREVMVTAMALAPMNPAYYLPLARACRDRGMDSRAADLYRKYLAQRPPPGDATTVRAELEALPADSSPFHGPGKLHQTPTSVTGAPPPRASGRWADGPMGRVDALCKPCYKCKPSMNPTRLPRGRM